MAFFEDSHMREPYPRDPRILFKPWYHLWQRFFWSSCVFSNFCFKWSPVKHYKSALLVDNFFQSDDFLEDFSCGNWNSNEIGKLYSSPNHHHQKIRGNHKFFAVSFPIWTLSKEGWFSIFESFHWDFCILKKFDHFLKFKQSFQAYSLVSNYCFTIPLLTKSQIPNLHKKSNWNLMKSRF